MRAKWICKYIEYGTKELSSGSKSDLYYNFRNITEYDKKRVIEMLKKEARDLIIVGIKTMGFEIAKQLDYPIGESSVYCYDPQLDMITNGKFCKPYLIFDDVITTFGTIHKCIGCINKFFPYLPDKVISIVNRMNIIDLSEVKY